MLPYVIRCLTQKSAARFLPRLHFFVSIISFYKLHVFVIENLFSGNRSTPVLGVKSYFNYLCLTSCNNSRISFLDKFKSMPLTSSGESFFVIGLITNIVPSLRFINTSPTFPALSRTDAKFSVGFGHILHATGMARYVLTKHSIHSRLPTFTG